MKMKSMLLFCVFMLVAESSAQDEWNWGWDHPPEQASSINHFQTAINSPTAEKSIYSKLIWFYKRKVSPVQAIHCPCYPSCSTFTLYSMQKYGFFLGLLMGIDRLYFRENREILNKIHYWPIHITGRIFAYDPPEANFIFEKKDWRILDPYFHDLFFEG